MLRYFIPDINSGKVLVTDTRYPEIIRCFVDRGCEVTILSSAGEKAVHGTLQLNALQIKREKEYFDLVAVLSFGHSPELPLEDIKDILKPGGIIFACSSNRDAGRSFRRFHAGLEPAGFRVKGKYAVLPGMPKVKAVLPLDDEKALKYLMVRAGEKERRRALRAGIFLFDILPLTFFLERFSGALAVLAEKRGIGC